MAKKKNGRKEKERKVKKEIGKTKIKSRKIRVRRVDSGIPGFDKLIEGGLEKNSVNLIVGSSGSGKTILAMQFLIEGVKRGENALYITFEEKRDEFFKNMLNFGWDLEKAEKERKFFFLEYNPEKVRVMLEEGGGMIENIVMENKIKRIVIDSITSFALLFEEELAKREAALSLFNLTRKWKCTSLLTLQEEPAKRTDGSSVSLEFEADSIVLLYYVRHKNKRRRFVEILKMRGTKHSTEIHPLNITRKGVSVGKGVFRDHLVSDAI